MKPIELAGMEGKRSSSLPHRQCPMRSTIIFLLSLGAPLIGWGYELPNEKAFLNQPVANIEVLTADGARVELYSLFKGRPVILSPIYTRCPKACSVITAGLQSSVAELGTLGKDFSIITFSFDKDDTVEDLKAFIERWNLDDEEWKIVTSDSANIARLLQSIDYQYDFDPVSKQYDHPNIVVVLSAKGRIMQYLYGMRPKPRDVKLAALNAKREVAALGIVEGFYLRCFQYDPQTGTYHFDWSFLIEMVAGVLMVIICSIVVYKSFIVEEAMGQG